MPRLYQITIPGLSITAHFPAVRRRLLAEFPEVLEVLATTMPGTVLIAYRGEASDIEIALASGKIMRATMAKSFVFTAALLGGLSVGTAWAQPVTMSTADIHEGIRARRERRAPTFGGN